MNNDETLAKFLLASGLNLFSVRNPFDYICLFCKKCHYSYNDVLTTLEKFETKLAIAPNAAAKKPNPTEDITRALKNETEKILSDGKIKSPDGKLEQLIDFMVKHRDEFSTKNKVGKYNSGFSLQKIKMLNLFTKYLVMLYPTFDNFQLETRKVRTNLDGEPKIYGQFVRAIHQVYDFDALSWNFSDYEGDGVSTRKVANVAYKIPFNNSVVLPLKNMSKILRAMLRSPKDSDNYQDLDRNTILLFTYFFIEGYRCALRAKKLPAELTIEKLVEQTIAATTDDDKKKFLIALKEIVDKIYDLENPLPIANPPKPLDICIDAINQMLLCFDFTSCYLPFLLDRFVLLCLLKNPVDQNGVHQYLLESVLKEAAEQTEEEISSKIMEAHNEQKQSR